MGMWARIALCLLDGSVQRIVTLSYEKAVVMPPMQVAWLDVVVMFKSVFMLLTWTKVL